MSLKMSSNMTSKSGFLILCVIATFQFMFQTCVSQSLDMTVYYESLCPDCQNFFTKQFEPNFENFVNFVNWNLIPYGNAITHRYANGTVKSIKCQHRKAECYGNAVQACVLREVPDYLTQTRFCLCFMVNKGDNKALEKCAQTYKLDQDRIDTCAKSRKGLEFLADYGNIQREASPPIEAVPTLALNGKQLTAKEDEEFSSNSCKFLCDRLKAQKPEVCKSCAPPVSTQKPKPSK